MTRVVKQVNQGAPGGVYIVSVVGTGFPLKTIISTLCKYRLMRQFKIFQNVDQRDLRLWYNGQNQTCLKYSSAS